MQASSMQAVAGSGEENLDSNGNDNHYNDNADDEQLPRPRFAMTPRIVSTT